MKDAIGIKRWNNMHAAVLLLSIISVIAFDSVVILSALCLSSFLWHIIQSTPFLRSFKPFGGYANWITFLRLCCIMLIGFSFPLLDDLSIAVLAIIIIALDGLDGFLARKFDSSSEWGAYFDMETDSFYVCLMSSIIYLRDYLGPWILLIGYMRYFFVIIQLLTGISEKKEEGARFEQTVAVVLFVSLVTPFVFDKTLYMPCVVISSLLVLISFSRPFLHAG